MRASKRNETAIMAAGARDGPSSSESYPSPARDHSLVNPSSRAMRGRRSWGEARFTKRLVVVVVIIVLVVIVVVVIVIIVVVLIVVIFVVVVVMKSLILSSSETNE